MSLINWLLVLAISNQKHPCSVVVFAVRLHLFPINILIPRIPDSFDTRDKTHVRELQVVVVVYTQWGGRHHDAMECGECWGLEFQNFDIVTVMNTQYSEKGPTDNWNWGAVCLAKILKSVSCKWFANWKSISISGEDMLLWKHKYSVHWSQWRS